MIVKYDDKTITAYGPVSAGVTYIFLLEKWDGIEFVSVTEKTVDSEATFNIEEDGYYRISEVSSIGEIVEDYELVVYEYLELFYKDLLSNKLIKGVCNCACVSKHDELVISTLTIGLEMIKILIKYKQYYEADRVLKQLKTCDSFININCSCND